MLALINLAKRAANPAIDVLATNDSPTDSLLDDAPVGSATAPGVVVIRLAAPLFFANGDVFAHAVKRAVTRGAATAPVHDLVVDMEAVSDVDVTAAESFASLKEWLRGEDVTLSFSRVRPGARERLTTFGILADETVYRQQPRRHRRPRAAASAGATSSATSCSGTPRRRSTARRAVPGPPTDTIHITRSSN